MEIKNIFNALPLTAAAILQHPDFAGKLTVAPVVAGRAIGYSARTTYNRISLKRFPVPTIDQEGREMVRVEDLLAYVAGLRPRPARRKPGTPKKRDRIARREAEAGGAE